MRLVVRVAVLGALVVGLAAPAAAFPVITATGGFPVLPIGEPLAGETITTTYESASMTVSFTPLTGGQVVGQGEFVEFSQFDDGNSRCDWRATFTLFIVGEFDGASMMSGTFSQSKSVEILPGCEVDGVDTALEDGDTSWTALVDLDTGTVAQATGFAVPWEVSFDPADVFPSSADVAVTTVDFAFDLGGSSAEAEAAGFEVEVLVNEGSLFLDSEGNVLDGFARVRMRFEDADGFVFVSESSYVFRGDGQVDHITSTMFEQNGEILGVDVTEHPRNPFTVDLGGGSGTAVVDAAGTEFTMLFEPVDLPDPVEETTSTTQSATVDDDIGEVFADGDPIPEEESTDGGGSRAPIFVLISALVAGGVYYGRKYLIPRRPESVSETPQFSDVQDHFSLAVGVGVAADLLDGLRERIEPVEVAGDEERQALVRDIARIGRGAPSGVHNLHLRRLIGAVENGDGVTALDALGHATEALRNADEAAKDTGDADPADLEQYLDTSPGSTESSPSEHEPSDIDEVLLGGSPRGRWRGRWNRQPRPKTQKKTGRARSPKARPTKDDGSRYTATIPPESPPTPEIGEVREDCAELARVWKRLLDACAEAAMAEEDARKRRDRARDAADGAEDSLEDQCSEFPPVCWEGDPDDSWVEDPDRPGSRINRLDLFASGEWRRALWARHQAGELSADEVEEQWREGPPEGMADEIRERHRTESARRADLERVLSEARAEEKAAQQELDARSEAKRAACQEAEAARQALEDCLAQPAPEPDPVPVAEPTSPEPPSPKPSRPVPAVPEKPSPRPRSVASSGCKDGSPPRELNKRTLAVQIPMGFQPVIIGGDFHEAEMDSLGIVADLRQGATVSEAFERILTLAPLASRAEELKIGTSASVAGAGAKFAAQYSKVLLEGAATIIERVMGWYGRMPDNEVVVTWKRIPYRLTCVEIWVCRNGRWVRDRNRLTIERTGEGSSVRTRLNGGMTHSQAMAYINTYGAKFSTELSRALAKYDEFVAGCGR